MEEFPSGAFPAERPFSGPGRGRPPRHENRTGNAGEKKALSTAKRIALTLRLLAVISGRFPELRRWSLTFGGRSPVVRRTLSGADARRQQHQQEDQQRQL